MSVNEGETIVAVGWTDGYRYVGVTPPLTEDEISRLDKVNAVPKYCSIQQIDEFEPNSSLFCVSGDFDLVTPSRRTEKAHEVARNVAEVLRHLRTGVVTHDLRVVALNGHNSTPFYPDTDYLRRSLNK